MTEKNVHLGYHWNTKHGETLSWQLHVTKQNLKKICSTIIRMKLLDQTFCSDINFQKGRNAMGFPNEQKDNENVNTLAD